jgi:hypothetical protein
MFLPVDEQPDNPAMTNKEQTNNVVFLINALETYLLVMQTEKIKGANLTHPS